MLRDSSVHRTGSGNAGEATLHPRTVGTIGFQRTTRDSSVRKSGTTCSNHLLLGGTGRTLMLSSLPPPPALRPARAGSGRRSWKAIFGPGSGPEVGWRCGGSGWRARSPGGGGSRSTAEPDVCRALTGVAEGAVPDHGELQGAGSSWVVGGEKEGTRQVTGRDRVPRGMIRADPRMGAGVGWGLGAWLSHCRDSAQLPGLQ